MKIAPKIFLMVLAALLFAYSVYAADQASGSPGKARTQDKEVVIYLYSQHCPYCDAMDRNVLSDAAVSATLKKDFIYIRADVDKRPEIAEKYRIRGYPTTVLTEGNGRIIAKIPGYIPKKDFQKILSYLKGKHYKTTKLGDFLDGNG